MIRVMVVDDSPLVRRVAGDILDDAPGIEVVATAATAEFALTKLDRERPDVITMDLEMPGMGGCEAIRAIMARRPTPIVVLSAHASRGAELTLQALDAGAVDFVLKPSASLSGGLASVARELVEAVRCAASVPVALRSGQRESLHGQAAEAIPKSSPAGRAPAATHCEIVAIGTSTGGPVALRALLSELPPDLPAPVVVVQHMPALFTRAFAQRLDSLCGLAVKEAEDGDLLAAGSVLVAPGDYHMEVERRAAGSRVLLDRRPAVCGHRPSVDVLMRSVAREYGSRAVGVIMTGMGKDGAEGIHELHRAGGFILSQDEESSTIFGMNREVIANGDADVILPLEQLSQCIAERVGGAPRGSERASGTPAGGGR